jgi:hypothetical protein
MGLNFSSCVVEKKSVEQNEHNGLNFSSCGGKKEVVEQNEHDGFEFLKLEGKKKNCNKMNKACNSCVTQQPT